MSVSPIRLGGQQRRPKFVEGTSDTYSLPLLATQSYKQPARHQPARAMTRFTATAALAALLAVAGLLSGSAVRRPG